MKSIGPRSEVRKAIQASVFRGPGFDGGGGTHGSTGGGGYSGGGGSSQSSSTFGGGGGSYNSGTNQSNTSGARASQGLVTIHN